MTKKELIEKIMKDLHNQGDAEFRNDYKTLEKILNDNLPQTTGVDALVENIMSEIEEKENDNHIGLVHLDDIRQILNKHLQQPTQTEEREVEINKKPRTTDSYGPKFKCGCGYDTIRGNRYCPNCGGKILWIN